MPNNLDFSTLVPDRDTFTDTDRQKHEFKARLDFGAVDLAKVKRLQKVIETALDRLAEQPDDEQAAEHLEEQATEFVKLILPTLSAKRIATMMLGQKTRIVEWWTAQEKGDSLVGESPASQPK